jgi:hypothetical protein
MMYAQISSPRATRRRLTSLIVLAILTLSAAVAGAEPVDTQGQLSFLVEPLIQKVWGGSAYDLSADAGSGISVQSRLEFPTTHVEAGVSLGVAMNEAERQKWMILASVATSAFATTGTMNDSDWTLYPGYPRVPWSYTESTDTTTSIQASAEAAWLIASTGPVSLSLYGYYRFQYASHVENGITGWQYVWNTGISAYDLYTVSSSTKDVLEYSLMENAPGIGFLAGLRILEGWSAELRAAYTPVYISDRDDHKLRTKLSTAEGWGNGVYLDLRTSYELKPVFGSVVPYIALDGSLIWFTASLLQTQYWYGNADAANGAPQGTKQTGIEHIVSSTQYRAGLRVGFRL